MGIKLSIPLNTMIANRRTIDFTKIPGSDYKTFPTHSSTLTA